MRVVRTADADARRRQLADAVIAVVGAHGLERATLARVGAAADATTGLVQQYFRTKDELLDFAFNHLVERTLERVAAARSPGSVANQLLRVLSTLLPLDDERRLEGKVWLALLARAAHSPHLARIQAAGQQRVRDELGRAIRLAQQRGQAAPDLDADREAAMLTAFVDGLWLHMMCDPDTVSADDGRTQLASYLDRLFLQPTSQPTSEATSEATR